MIKIEIQKTNERGRALTPLRVSQEPLSPQRCAVSGQMELLLLIGGAFLRGEEKL